MNSHVPQRPHIGSIHLLDEIPRDRSGGIATDFNQRLYELLVLAGRLAAYKRSWRLVALIFAQPDSAVFANQIAPKLDYWAFRSGPSLDFMCVGYDGYPGRYSFNIELFARSVRWLQERSAWRYSGDTDFVLLNAKATFDGTNGLDLQTDRLVAFSLEAAIEDGAFKSAGAFMERLFAFADRYEGDDPTWGFSDDRGGDLVLSALKSVLVNCLPRAVRKAASAAFHLRIREYAVEKGAR